MNISNTPVSDFDAAVRLLSGGTNVAIYNDLGIPSIYVRRDKGEGFELFEPGFDGAHYAFIVNGVEIPAFYMGKYLATVYKGRALSLPLQDPAAGTIAAADRGAAPSSNVTFDNARIWCEANGAGFHLPTIAEYAWIAALSRKNGTLPHGNNSYGADVAYPYEIGLASHFDEEGRICSTLTGSGPAKWNDNWQPDGICDLNGNIKEWQGGYRTVDGEIQIIADNDAAMQCNQNTSSTLWKAILPNGTLVEPGTPGTLKWDYTKAPGNATTPFRLNTELEFQQTTAEAFGANTLSGKSLFYEYTGTENGIIRLIQLGLLPDLEEKRTYGNDVVYMRNRGECLSFRGGSWNDSNGAGVYNVNCCGSRAYYYKFLGFRPAFIPGI